MHSPGSRWEFRERAVVYFGFFACIPPVRILVFVAVTWELWITFQKSIHLTDHFRKCTAVQIERTSERK